jgi:hypothetical protein
MAVGETGLPTVREVGKIIETLHDRLTFLTTKVIVRREEGRVTDWEEREIRALLFAIPIVEAEWDTYARMNRDRQAMEKRFGASERRGDGGVKHVSPEKVWRPDVPYEGMRPEVLR